MKMHEQTREETQIAPQAKKAYHPPQVVDFGDVRELTRGGANTRADGKNTTKK